MAFFSIGKDKQSGSCTEQVLAYLEDAQRQKSRIIAIDSRKLELTGSIITVDDGAGAFTILLQGPFSGNKGFKVELFLYHDNLRLGMFGTLLEQKGNTITMELPGELELRERRKQLRARTNPKEYIHLTGLTGLFDGIGIHGAIENISEGGCLVRIEKALNIQSDKRLPLGRALVPVGQQFPIIKLNKVPQCPSVMEFSGKVIAIDENAGLCLRLELAPNEFTRLLKKFVSTRVGEMPTALPSKQRRKPEETLEKKNERESVWDDVSLVPDKPLPRESPKTLPKLSDPEPNPVSVPASFNTSPSAGPPCENLTPDLQSNSEIEGAKTSQDEIVSAKTEGPAAPETTSVIRNPNLIRLKKRSRTVLVLSEEARNAEITQYLLAEGYKQVITATGWDEVVANLQGHEMDLLLIDVFTPILQTIAMVRRLKDAGLELPPIVLSANDVSISVISIAHMAGIKNLLKRPFELDDGFSGQLEQALGL